MHRPFHWLALALLVFFSAGTAAAQSVSHVLVNKSERRMQIMDGETVVKTYSIALGGSPEGHKQKEGDERTPEGTYTLDWRNPGSGYHRSIHVSYPNEADTARAAAAGEDPGGMIMIHGQRNYLGWLSPLTQWFDWTNGCIAVSNAEMDEIWDLVKNGTPIEIRP
ncbi:L,D-transpeptidase family protein [Rhizobiales bacterium RZME27]|uniref:L,D-transpeptidase family protein n=1 Tax=Endobacterium cereale TaxID=2663029 RepID=A0A6A8A8E8_9HYPH|nr:L,D-transpeptidase family protein [Endobacterium cereale]MEB2847041.1 L,D-transpeptidase family protein [Endobacterium cereale]MQY47542.1 L,D-transpeptidase family protein [Endobacterium cereale]